MVDFHTGEPFFHAWPQALKVGVLRPRAGRRFDAVAKLERIDDHLEEIRVAAGGGAGGGGDLGFLRRHRHSTAALPCARVDLADAALRRRLCALYEADYACFGYAGCNMASPK